MLKDKTVNEQSPAVGPQHLHPQELQWAVPSPEHQIQCLVSLPCAHMQSGAPATTSRIMAKQEESRK